MEDKFASYLADYALVRSELLQIARPEHLGALAKPAPAPIAIHVRRSDFVQQGSYEDMVSVDNSVLPMESYINALRAVRSAAGHEIPAWLFSDGPSEELSDLLAQPAIRRMEYGSGLADMLGPVTQPFAHRVGLHVQHVGQLSRPGARHLASRQTATACTDRPSGARDRVGTGSADARLGIRVDGTRSKSVADGPRPHGRTAAKPSRTTPPAINVDNAAPWPASRPAG